jgi:hypothetical protein
MSTILLKYFIPLTPYLLIAFVILGPTFYVLHLRHDLSAADQDNALQASQISSLVQTNAENVAAIAADKLQQAKWKTALDTLDAQTLTTNAATDGIIDAITIAPSGADAPVAPVLAQALAGIAKLQGSAL